jgi:hypothetical protein
MNGQRKTTVFTEADTRRILADAVRIDQLRTDGLSIEEIRLAATDAGIREESIMEAVALFESRPSKHVEPDSALAGLATFGAAGAGIAILGEILAPSILGGAPQVNALYMGVAIVMISGGISAVQNYNSARLAFLKFQAKNLGLWLGFGLGTYGAFKNVGEGVAHLIPEAMVSVAVIWGASSVIGGLFAAWRGRSSNRKPGLTSTGALVSDLKRRVAVRLKKWIDDVMMRVRGRLTTKPIVVPASEFNCV